MEAQQIKHLPLEFKGRGSQKTFFFNQVKRLGKIALYEKSDIETKDKYYEVIVISSHNGITLGGVYLPPAENYPSDASFGASGWCYKERERAENKYQELVTKQTATIC